MSRIPVSEALQSRSHRERGGRWPLGLSVIIPVGPDETAWKVLLGEIAPQLTADDEVLIAATEPMPPGFETGSAPFPARWLTCRSGRAAQMNDAAAASKGEFLWFLHADSHLPSNALAALDNALRERPDDLHYFGLRFSDGPALLKLNEIGVSLRCRLFGLPFGDQGLCIRRNHFDRLGGFDEDAPFGEDHLLVWSARRAGVRLRRVPAVIGTSGRKYARHGWLRTTSRHVRLTLRQALAEGLRGSTGPR